ncbi:hypothetical protein ES705_46619 [subsurface metagenome]
MNIDKINKVIIKYRLIRRAIVFILLPIVVAIDIDSYLLCRIGSLEYTTGLIGFLGIINGLVGTIIAFYFTNKNESCEAD